MLSVIVYGRNDSHGYNLHKRAAISLNCIAHVLTGRDDEILFVDYNTPDDLPTFPEAIQDTLTETAKRLVRVLRVRPAQHLQFARRSHLAALEPVARNVALRRSNPNNRWVLSTNTDMIFTPRSGRLSFQDAIADLEDGFYHLPRYELPEALWEGFDRQDPEMVTVQAARWGGRFHLNEIVNESELILYDAPGDFQLALRDDLFRISGFDETMLLGWHVDSNLASRMRLLRGEIRSLASRLAAYHCDHTRQATILHRADRIENDFKKCVEEIVSPELPSQAASWGMPDEDIEEIRLRHSPRSRYLQTLERLLPDPAQDAYQVRYSSDASNRLSYPLDHVLPYVVDQLSCVPARATICYLGAREDTFAAVKAAVSELLPQARLALPEQATWLAAEPADDRLPVSEWLNAGHTYVFEFGEPEEPGADSPESYPTRNAEVLSMLSRLSGAVGENTPHVVAINAIRNQFELPVNALVRCTPTPFSTRVRHGYLTGRTAFDFSLGSAGLDNWLGLGMKRAMPAPQGEIQRFISQILKLLADPETVEPAWWEARLHAEPLRLLLSYPGLARLLGSPPDEVERLRRRLEFARPSHAVAAHLRDIELRPGRPGAFSRLANVEDWEDPGFLKWIRGWFGGLSGYNLFERSAYRWERAALLSTLASLIPLDAPSGASQARILVVAPGAEPIAGVLAGFGLKVDIAHPGWLREDGTGADWRSELAQTDSFARLLGRWDEQHGNSAGYDAVICTENSIGCGAAAIAKLLKAIDRRLQPEGLLLFSARVRLDGGSDAGCLPLWFLAAAEQGFASATGYAPAGDVDLAVSPLTLDRTSRAGFDNVVFVQEERGYRTASIWSWRKGPDAEIRPARFEAAVSDVSVQPPEEFAVSERFLALEPGQEADITRRMSWRAGLKRGVGEVRVAADEAEGYVLYGPYVRVFDGLYRAEIEISAEAQETSGPAVSLDAALALEEIARQEFDISALTGRVWFDFRVPPGRAGDLLEVRVRHLGRVPLRIGKVKLIRLA